MSLEWAQRAARQCDRAGVHRCGHVGADGVDPKARKLRGGAVPQRRLGAADDIANAVLFLASEQAAYINGHELVVDGGVVNSILMQLPRD